MYNANAGTNFYLLQSLSMCGFAQNANIIFSPEFTGRYAFIYIANRMLYHVEPHLHGIIILMRTVIFFMSMLLSRKKRYFRNTQHRYALLFNRFCLLLLPFISNCIRFQHVINSNMIYKILFLTNSIQYMSTVFISIKNRNINRSIWMSSRLKDIAPYDAYRIQLQFTMKYTIRLILGFITVSF